MVFLTYGPEGTLLGGGLKFLGSDRLVLLTSPSFSTHIEPTSDPDSRRVIIASINRRLVRSSATDLSFFCDGSRKRCGVGEKQSGFGVIYPGSSVQDSISVGVDRRSSVFDAEMFALAHSAKRALEMVSSGDVTSVSFFSDSVLSFCPSSDYFY